MILEPGSIVLLSHRRLFESDHSRYFLGTVDGYEDGVASVTGYTWIRDAYLGHYVRKDDVRTKIVSLSSGTVIVYRLPDSVRVPAARIESQDTSTVLTDYAGFTMDLTEGILNAPDANARRSA